MNVKLTGISDMLRMNISVRGGLHSGCEQEDAVSVKGSSSRLLVVSSLVSSTVLLQSVS